MPKLVGARRSVYVCRRCSLCLISRALRYALYPCSPFSWCAVLSVDSVVSRVAPRACGMCSQASCGLDSGSTWSFASQAQRARRRCYAARPVVSTPAGLAASSKKCHQTCEVGAPSCVCGCAPSRPARRAAARPPAQMKASTWRHLQPRQGFGLASVGGSQHSMQQQDQEHNAAAAAASSS